MKFDPWRNSHLGASSSSSSSSSAVFGSSGLYARRSVTVRLGSEPPCLEESIRVKEKTLGSGAPLLRSSADPKALRIERLLPETQKT